MAETQSTNAALYNKYRPTTFNDIVGQEDIVASLSNAVESNSTPHSFIFAGPRGTGKTTIARIVARALNCAHPVNGSPCEECESCSMSINDSPGYREFDGASNSGVNDARAIAEEIRGGTSMAVNRIFVIDEVQEMSSAAVTALLKVFEEPPSHTFIIFCTTDPESLPSTIRSRGTIYYFNPVPDDQIADLVRSVVERDGHGSLDEETIQAIVMEGDGSPREALSVLQRVILGGKAVISGQGVVLAEAIVRKDLGGAIMSIAEAVSAGSSMNALCSETLSALRDIFICAYAPSILSQARREDIESRFPADELDQLGDEARIAIPEFSNAQRISRTGSEPRGVIEAAVISIILGKDQYSSGGDSGIGAADVNRILRAINDLSKRLDAFAANSGADQSWPSEPIEPTGDAPTVPEVENEPEKPSNAPGKAQEEAPTPETPTATGSDLYGRVKDVVIDAILSARGLNVSSATRRKRVSSEIEGEDVAFSLFIDADTDDVVLDSKDWSGDEAQSVLQSISEALGDEFASIVVTEDGLELSD